MMCAFPSDKTKAKAKAPTLRTKDQNQGSKNRHHITGFLSST